MSTPVTMENQNVAGFVCFTDPDGTVLEPVQVTRAS